MARIDRPVAGTKGAAGSRAGAAPEAAHPIDWRQLSHELRTPLNAILGNVELLLDGSAGPLSAEARTCIGEIQVAGRALLHQVRLLLAWSELSAGRTTPRDEAVDLIALVREAAVVASAGPAQIEPHDACLRISGDPFWLRVLVAEVLALPGAPDAAPTIRLQSAAGDCAIRFVRPGFCAELAGALRMALIESIARRLGAVTAAGPDGVTLRWPAERRDQPAAARRRDGPA
jgi:hypothetical protein